MDSKCNKCLVRELGALKQLNQEELKHLSKVKQELSFKKGDTIFNEGKTVGGVYCLRNGKCKLSRLNGNGKEQIVRFIKGGDLIGYRSLFSDEPVTLTVSALESMEACYIPKDEIMRLMKSNNDFAMGMLKEVCHVLKVTNDSLAKMAQKSVKERLADTLLAMEESFGINENGEIDLKLSREEIASYIGTATESAIRLISDLKKEGVISVKGKMIRIEDKERLIHISEGFKLS
jgi:CRP-like cAMP-binding protein